MKASNWIFLLILLTFTGCLEEPPTLSDILKSQLKAVNQEQLTADIEAIDLYLAEQEIQDVLIESNGVRYVITDLGTGSKPKLSNNIIFDYKLSFLLDEPDFFEEGVEIAYPLSSLIIAWKLVLPLLPEGTRVTMYVPSGFAYGSSGVKNPNTGEIIIPPDTNLIFELYLRDVF